VTVNDREIGRLSPAQDFTWELTVPAQALAAAGGHVRFESDKWFVPGERDGSGDRRHLAVRVYAVTVR
jgi:hypothetical protein